MVAPQLTAVGTASAILAVSKAAWKLGSSLSRLHQDTNFDYNTIKNLAEEVKSLGNECDLVYAELEVVVSKSELESPQPYDAQESMWICLAKQVEESSRTMQELELFVKRIRVEEASYIGQDQQQRKLASIRTEVCSQTDNLRTMQVLVNIVLTYIAPCRADRDLGKELDKLRAIVEKLQRLSEANPYVRSSHTEATIKECAREIIKKGTTLYDTILTAKYVTGGQGPETSTIRVAEWVTTLESLRRDQRRSDPPNIISNDPSIMAGDESYSTEKSTTLAECSVQEREAVDTGRDDSDNDLDTDLAKAALDTGSKAFEAREWEEANSLLQEALCVLQQLPKQQRAFCDIFGLQYKLAVCAYHIQGPADAEQALVGLVQQPASSDEQRGYIYNAAHLLSLLYIRIGQVDRARSECEKVLQGRRRLLGKRSDPSLESTALMAHIYVLLNNSARAKSYLAMIPEACRDAVLRNVEESLGTKVEQLDSSSSLTQSISEGSDLTVNHIQNRLSASSLTLPVESRPYSSITAMTSQSSVTSIRQSHQSTLPNKAGVEDPPFATITYPSAVEDRSESRAADKYLENKDCSTSTRASVAVAPSSGELFESNEIFKGRTLSRKEILDKVGCQPRDRIEDAVCDGNHSVLASLLDKKKGFWQSKLRKHIRPERVTALHFAALFGEIDMARRLLGSGFNINEVPYGYTSSLTPLNFAIGARQANMVEFLLANGAKPSEPDSWSSLAGQLMNHSWLMKTMSEAEKEDVPDRIIMIMRILFKQGWNVNAPFEKSGGTVLHQAVTFWTGSYLWDLNLRAAVTTFLCERGADPFQANAKGKTPYDMSLASGHQDLLLILGRGPPRIELDSAPVGLAEPFELPT